MNKSKLFKIILLYNLTVTIVFSQVLFFSENCYCKEDKISKDTWLDDETARLEFKGMTRLCSALRPAGTVVQSGDSLGSVAATFEAFFSGDQVGLDTMARAVAFAEGVTAPILGAVNIYDDCLAVSGETMGNLALEKAPMPEIAEL